jgi:hypothetical protein
MLARNALMQAIYPESACGVWVQDSELFATEEAVAAALQKAVSNPAQLRLLKVFKTI